MSTPEPRSVNGGAPGVRLANCTTDVVEIAALRGRAVDLERIATDRGTRLPARGRVVLSADQAALCVRPERWLLLAQPAAPGACAAAWQEACASVGAAVDLSSGLAVLHLAGPAVRELLARGCRLDLDSGEFAPGRAAATIVAQVPVILAATPAGMLLLTPATTARHFCEWLDSSAAPHGLERLPAARLSRLCGEPPS